MSDPRTATVWLKNITPGLGLEDYNYHLHVKSMTFEEVAYGESDSLSFVLDTRKFRKERMYYHIPKIDYVFKARILFQKWDIVKDKYHHDYGFMMDCGTFWVDTISIDGASRGDMTVQLLPVSVTSPFKTEERTKTWEGVTVKQILDEITSRYGMTAFYDAQEIWIDSIEQNDRSDSAFLAEIARDYGLGLKVYSHKIILYDIRWYERQQPHHYYIDASEFENNAYQYKETINDTYTGAIVKYKKPDSDEEITCHVGNIGSGVNSPGVRIKKINTQAANEREAKIKAAAVVNESMRKMHTLSGSIFPIPDLVAGTCFNFVGASFGGIDGKYFIDSVKTTVSADGTKQDITAHMVVPPVYEGGVAWPTGIIYE